MTANMLKCVWSSKQAAEVLGMQGEHPGGLPGVGGLPVARIWAAVLFLEGQTCQEYGGGLASGPLGIEGTVRTEHRRVWVSCAATPPRSGPSVCPGGRRLCPSPCSRGVILPCASTLFARSTASGIGEGCGSAPGGLCSSLGPTRCGTSGQLLSLSVPPLPRVERRNVG